MIGKDEMPHPYGADMMELSRRLGAVRDYFNHGSWQRKILCNAIEDLEGQEMAIQREELVNIKCGGMEPIETTVPQDNWKHRSKGMVCDTCMFYVSKVDDVRSQELPVGRCRRHAPTMSGWPVMFHNDWCGDHKLNEQTVEVE